MIIDDLSEFLQKYMCHVEYSDRNIGRRVLEKSINELKQNKETIEFLQNKVEELQDSVKKMSEKISKLELSDNIQDLVKNFNLLTGIAYECVPPKKYSRLDEIVHELAFLLDQKMEE